MSVKALASMLAKKNLSVPSPISAQPSTRKFDALKVEGSKTMDGAISAGPKKRLGAFVANGGKIA